MLRLFSSMMNLRTAPKPANMTGEGEKPANSKRKRKGGYTEFTSYYGRPVVKKPHWVAPIWAYFWVGGITAGSSAIAVLAELVGDERDQSIIRAGRYISMAGLLISPVLLIVDLQRPERFLHMLRVLKLRSPLSLGTYILTSTAILGGFNTARQVVIDGLIPANSLPGKLALASSSKFTRALQGIDGLALGGYTGVLLSATAVPLWADMDALISPLFIASSFSTGAAAISLARALAGTPLEELHRLDRIEQTAILTELALLGAAAVKLTPEVRKHLFQGLHGKGFMGALGLGMLGPLLLQIISPKQGAGVRPMNILTALMVLVGGFLLRYSLIEAGKASADDSGAYHSITRGKGRATGEEQAAQGRKQTTRIPYPEYGPVGLPMHDPLN